MLNNIFIAIIIIAVVAIIIVVVRKFSIIANLDLKNLLEEKEHKKKQELIRKKLEDRGQDLRNSLQNKLSPLKGLWSILQKKFRVYVGKIEKLLHYEDLLKNRNFIKQLSVSEKKNKLDSLIQKAHGYFVNNNFEKAEESYISAIKFNKKSAKAYRGLADTYFAKGSIDEAIQTYDFLTKLTPDDDDLFFRLSGIFEEIGKINEAIHYLERAIAVNDSMSSRFYHLAELFIKVDQHETALESVSQAVEIEPKNPKYLDLLIEIAIICKNKKISSTALDELRIVNPENQKLQEFKERVESI